MAVSSDRAITNRLTSDRMPADLDTDVDARWRADFEVHRGQHRTIGTAGMWTLAPAVKLGLQESIPTFQLGETGTGGHLLRMAAATGSDDYVEAVRLFVLEEQEHARLLGLVCEAIDAPQRESHWTDRVFRWARRLLGLRAEVLMLLVAEIVALRFYATLATGVGDHVLSRIFERIRADEARHIDFHAATLPSRLRTWSTPTWWLARVGWNVTVIGTAAVVAGDHRRVLRACGSGPLRFFVEVVALHLRAEHRFFDRGSRLPIQS